MSSRASNIFFLKKAIETTEHTEHTENEFLLPIHKFTFWVRRVLFELPLFPCISCVPWL